MNKQREYDVFDLTKFVLSIVIVAIHTHPLGEFHLLIYPWARIAVPIFFMISSYLFFSKLNTKKTEKEICVEMKLFCLRNAKLYLFWFILLFPVTAYTKHYFADGIGRGLRKLFIDFLFGSTFRMSWYLMALILCVIVVYYSSRLKHGAFIIFIIGLLSNSLCCLFSNYAEATRGIYDLFSFYPGTFFLSFPVGLIWVSLGNIFSKNDYTNVKSKYLWIGFLFSCVGLTIEQRIIYRIGIPENNDCYFMLWPVCSLLFLLLLRINIRLKNPKILRKISVVVYCLHGSILLFVRKFMDMIDISYKSLPGSFFCFAIVVFSCCVAALCLQSLAKKEKGHWLKYAF